MEKKCKYEEVRFDEIDVNIERSHEYEEKYGKNRHLPENNRSRFVFLREKETIQNKGYRDGYEDCKESYE